MTLKERIALGLRGDFEGLSNGFNRINDYIFGVQRRCITLIGGLSGTYKSTILDFIIQNAILDAEKKGVTLNLFYNSFEIDELSKKCNWLSVQIYLKYGIVVPPEVIKGFGKNRLTKEQQQLVDDVEPEVERLFSRIQWNFTPENPTGIYNRIWKFMETRGTFEKQDYYDTESNSTKQKIIKFVPKDPDEYNLMCTDHLYLAKKERGFDTKRNIDKLSEYQVETKNMFGFSFINLQQFNQGLSSVERQKYKGVDISPQQSDFRDTTNPYTDSDICLGLMCPSKLDMDECLKYDVNKLGEKMLMFKIIKNRLSRDNIAIGLYADAKSGTFKELEPVDKINYKNYE